MNLILYYLGLACLFTHELDAVTHKEWRILPLLDSMSENAAEVAFVALHVPLFFAILLLSHHNNTTLRKRARALFASFLVVHAVLHLSLSSGADYDFNGLLSRVLILAAGGFGLAYLAADRPWSEAVDEANQRVDSQTH